MRECSYEVAQSCPTLSDPMDCSRPHGLQPTRLLHPWDFPDKSTGVGCHCLLRILKNPVWEWHKNRQIDKMEQNKENKLTNLWSINLWQEYT